MLERGGDPALALEAGAELVVPGEARRDQLQRDPAIERQIGRAIHDAHATAAGDGLDAMTGELRAHPELGGRSRGEAAAEARADVAPAAGHRPDRVDEVVLGSLLEHVPTRAGGERAAGEERIALHREHDDGDVRRDLEKARDRRKRRLAGHVEVQHQHARTQLPGRAQRALDVAGLGHDLEARLGVEHHPQPAADHRVVVREDDLDPLPGSSSESGTVAPLYRRVRRLPPTDPRAPPGSRTPRASHWPPEKATEQSRLAASVSLRPARVSTSNASHTSAAGRVCPSGAVVGAVRSPPPSRRG